MKLLQKLCSISGAIWESDSCWTETEEQHISIFIWVLIELVQTKHPEYAPEHSRRNVLSVISTSGRMP